MNIWLGFYFLNKFNDKYPCFTETYQILQNNSEELKLRMKNNLTTPIGDILQNYSFYDNNNPITSSKSCINAKILAILVQYIENPFDFDNFLNKNFDNKNVTQILYQVYGPLFKLSKAYTHYDLLTKNVLLYVLQEKTYITINYLYKNKTVSFRIINNRLWKIVFL